MTEHDADETGEGSLLDQIAEAMPTVEGLRRMEQRNAHPQQEATPPLQPAAAPPMNPAAVRVGMTVYGADLNEVGTVKALRTEDFLIDLALVRDVYAPYRLIRTITENTIILGITAYDVGGEGWENPPLF